MARASSASRKHAGSFVAMANESRVAPTRALAKGPPDLQPQPRAESK